jgi:hypothetical protein
MVYAWCTAHTRTHAQTCTFYRAMRDRLSMDALPALPGPHAHQTARVPRAVRPSGVAGSDDHGTAGGSMLWICGGVWPTARQ